MCFKWSEGHLWVTCAGFVVIFLTFFISYISLLQVIHYELPNNSEIFVHRSGRTGRAGKKGTAILIYTRDETRAVRVIEKDVGCRFTEVTITLSYHFKFSSFV